MSYKMLEIRNSTFTLWDDGELEIEIDSKDGSTKIYLSKEEVEKLVALIKKDTE